MYKSINKILISLALFCAGINPCMAQGLVGPDDKPDAPTTAVAKIGSTGYTSLAAAFQAASGETTTIDLQLGVTLKEKTSVAVNNNIILRLQDTQLTCSAGLTATVAADKTFTLRGGSLSGSLAWEGTGKLFAGTDVDLSALTVTRNGNKRYRVLLEVPSGSVVKDILYGSVVTEFAQSGTVVCCWLPLHTAAQNISLSDNAGKRYIASGVVATAHAATLLKVAENVDPDVYIAEATETGGTTTKLCETLKEAFDALKTNGGTVKLRSNASLGESLPVSNAVSFDLNGQILSASYGAAFAASGSGKLHVKNGGALSGTFTITGDVVVDQSVAMAGANVIDGVSKNAVYRVRLTLPESAPDKNLTFTYGTKLDVAIPRTFAESSATIAYVWLPAESTAQSFTLKATGTPTEIVKNKVTINANHDNHIDLTTGDNVAKLTVGSNESLYTSFHGALEAAVAANANCEIKLLANVSLSGQGDHAYSTKASQLITIDLNGYNLTGYNLTGGNYSLNATADKSAYILIDSRKTGSLTGQLRIEGNVYITEEIAASKIGQIVFQSATGTPRYRLMATVSTQEALLDGFVTYQLGGSGTLAPCYVKDKKVCLFLPSGNNPQTLEVEAGSKTYSASSIVVSASHSNVATLSVPAGVAQIGAKTYLTLAKALAAAKQGANPVTIDLLNQASLSDAHTISKNLTIDLKEKILSASYGAEFTTSGSGNIQVTNGGALSGTLKIKGDVVIDQTVAMPGTNVIVGTNAVYRVRLTLPASVPNNNLTFTYGTKPSVTIPRVFTESGAAKTAYVWLPAESAAQSFTLKATGSPATEIVKNKVTINANHDNHIDLTTGDNVAKLTVGSKESLYTSFHGALEAAVAANANCEIKLLANVSLSGQGDHAYSTKASQLITIDLNGYNLTGYNLTGGNYSLNATADKSAYILIDSRKTGSLTGQLRIEGNVYITEEIAASKIGQIVFQSAPKTLRYRLMATVSTQEALPNGFVTYQLDGSGTLALCYVKDKKVCLFLPSGNNPQTLEVEAGGKIYSASSIVVSASHSNVATLSVPAGVAQIGAKTYPTLAKALTAAKLEITPVTIDLLNQASLSDAHTISKNLTIDLKEKILSASYGAEFTTSGSGNIHVKNGGALSGTLKINGDVVIDQSVAMAGANVIDDVSKNAVYRVRLTLPASAPVNNLTFTYGTKIGVAIPRVFTESGVRTAYVWLPAESIAQSFTLKATGTSTEIVKNKVTINANHDNHIDLTTGDNVAKLTVGSKESLYTSFHGALEAAAQTNANCRVELLANVSLNGESDHAHSTNENQLVTIDLNGHSLTGDNCSLDATADQSAYILVDSRKTGSLTGQLQIAGNVYITEEIAASKIGQIVFQSAPETPRYRLMATVSTQESLPDGFVTYQLDGSGTPAPCYIKDKKVCLFLPSGNNQHTLEVTVNNNLYSASNTLISASHSNVATLRRPTEVAKIGIDTYPTLALALAATKQETNPVTIELINQASLSGNHEISKNITIDLKEFTLKMEGADCRWNVKGGSLYIKSSTKTATIQGDFAVSEGVCISADVAIGGSVKKTTGEQVYRTRFYLPAGTIAANYKFNQQTGLLIFPGESWTDGRTVGYAFLQVESGYKDLKVQITNPQGLDKDTYELKQVFLQAFHNNQFDMEVGENVVRVNSTNYSLFSAALEVVNNNGGTIELLRDLSLSGAHTVTSGVTIDLRGFTLNTTDDAYFSIANGETLVITDSNTAPGSLYGILRMQGGALFVAPEVKIAGTVVCEGEELYRCLATAIGMSTYTGTITYNSRTAAIQSGTACFWLPPVTVEHDLAFQVDGQSYEMTLQPALPTHSNSAQAYPVVKVIDNTTWNNATTHRYSGYNVYIQKGVRLEIEAGAGITNLHRVVMENGAEIVCNSSILATAGITYRHEFVKDKTWEAFSLPYHARLVRIMSDTQQKEVRPYQIDGTGGDFWLKTIAPEGRFDYVTEERIMANTGYIIAVPRELTSMDDGSVRIDFVSPTDQFLNRKAAALPEPKAGEFVQTASGMLQKMKLERPFYKLNADGTEYMRVDATTAQPAEILPFTSFLLSDAKTLATHSTLRMGNLPTAVDKPLLPDLTVRVTGMAGGVRIESERDTTLQVYSLTGRPICLKKIAAGTTFLPLQSGLYIVNREKVVVR